MENDEGVVSKEVEEKSVLTEQEIIEKRKKAVINFIRNKTTIVYGIIIALIIWLSSRIRTRNLYGLKDITTGGWTLGPDLDPFLFLRWAKGIVAQGTLVVQDTMRYVPLGYNTGAELKLVPYSIAWTHKLLSIFGSTDITYAAIMMPVIAFALTIIAFYYLTKEIFAGNVPGKNTHKIIGAVAALILAVTPVILPRTIAGIPEKESLGFLFMFLAFYYFLKSWKQETIKKTLIYSALAGITTALMAHAWGGSIYIYFTIAVTVIIAYFFGIVDKKKYYSYAVWLLLSIILLIPFTERYTLGGLIASLSTGMAFAVLLILTTDYILFNTNIKKPSWIGKMEKKYSRPATTIIISLVAGGIIVSLIFGPGFIINFITHNISSLTIPYTDRLSFTVAENRQPFFTSEWKGTFGPAIRGIPIFFWLFFVGSAYLFNNLLKPLKKKDRMVMVIIYVLFLLALIFSKYDPNSKLNGTSGISTLLYFGGIAMLIIGMGYYYYKYYKRGDAELFKKISPSLILIFAFYFITIIGARSAIRLLMVLAPSATIIVSYLVVILIIKALRTKDDKKLIAYIIAAIVLIAAFYTVYDYTKQSYYQAQGFIPSIYTQQWQKAMEWVRDSTPENSVFAHWWDYGYWLQSIGERATIVDGGNQYPYWNHLISRHVLTNDYRSETTLEFLKTHDATHLLIDSTDIGKYSAFSNIGGDKDYDRYSYIPTLGLDERATLETSNGTIYAYQGGFGTDGDINYKENNKTINLPSGLTGVAGVTIKMITKNNETIIPVQPQVVLVYQGVQYRIPMRYAYFQGKFYDYNEGIEAGIMIVPVAENNGQGITMKELGAALYLSGRTVNTNFARMYLFNQEVEGFELVHSEDSVIVGMLKQQSPSINEFLMYQGLQGPIKIWEVSYDKNTKVHPEWLELVYPSEELYVVR
ncbi:hypothetical protein COU61_00195 [Candidatus Pacearchaeota archaeon CG10_big_fil_rev_8_21_14_0_10_35_13]|nr:MAG: hypothetical protein COU61_00195 [Candidatus Pacearchaeota archaeon CG10_big_fil_rev_8_21_14_0_10_35_13]